MCGIRNDSRNAGPLCDLVACFPTQKGCFREHSALGIKRCACRSSRSHRGLGSAHCIDVYRLLKLTNAIPSCCCCCCCTQAYVFPHGETSGSLGPVARTRRAHPLQRPGLRQPQTKVDCCPLYIRQPLTCATLHRRQVRHSLRAVWVQERHCVLGSKHFRRALAASAAAKSILGFAALVRLLILAVDVASVTYRSVRTRKNQLQSIAVRCCARSLWETFPGISALPHLLR
jgi:hypothetical protein